MARRETLTIIGGGDRPLPNELICRDDAPDHGMVLLPGRGYTTVMPAFYYLEEVALARGAAVLSLAPDYSRDERSGDWPIGDDGRDLLREDVLAAVEAMRAAVHPSRVTVVAKSLTTLGLAAVDWAAVSDRMAVDLVWLTPLLGDPAVAATLRGGPVPSLVVIGTADHAYDAAVLDDLESRGVVTVERVDGANHSFDHPGGLETDRSLANIGQVVRAVDRFVFADRSTAG